MSRLDAEQYKNLSDGEKLVLVEWYQKSGEALGVLKANGMTSVEALKMLRKGLTAKNLKHLDK